MASQACSQARPTQRFSVYAEGQEGQKRVLVNEDPLRDVDKEIERFKKDDRIFDIVVASLIVAVVVAAILFLIYFDIL